MKKQQALDAIEYSFDPAVFLNEGEFLLALALDDKPKLSAIKTKLQSADAKKKRLQALVEACSTEEEIMEIISKVSCDLDKEF